MASFSFGVATDLSSMAFSAKRAFRSLKGLKFPDELGDFTASPQIFSAAND
jgi:hypothetical protein